MHDLLRATDELPLSGLGQLGAAGTLLGILLWVCWQWIRRERDRADKNETEIARLNALILDRYAGSMERATEALAESNRILILYRDASSPRRRP